MDRPRVQGCVCTGNLDRLATHPVPSDTAPASKVAQNGNNTVIFMMARFLDMLTELGEGDDH